MKMASLPGVTHCLNRTMWPVFGYRLAASPGCMSVHWMVAESLLPMGAKSPVTKPGAGSPQAHDTKPEQSER